MVIIMNITFPLILDGAMGTQLQKAGLPAGCCPEKWVLEHSEVCETIQRAYVEAGSQVLYAPTFGANAAMLEGHGIFSEVRDYNERLVGISKSVAGEKALVAGDISSIGGMLYPLGDMSFGDMFDIYIEQAEALDKAGVDLFVIETMTSIPEARAAVLAAKAVSDKPVFVSFSCDENGRTMMGTDVCAALLIMQGMGVDAFGLNCSAGPAEILTQIKRLYEYAEIPLIAKPNAGLPVTVEGKTVYNVSPVEFAGFVPALADAGVSIFGACCGSDERYIAALKAALDSVSLKGVSPSHPELLPAATEKDVFLLSPAAECTSVFACDEELEDNICELDENELFGIEIGSIEDVAVFSDAQYTVKNPLCIFCDDAELLEKALRAYQGRALYDGALSEAELLPLCEKYGLII